VHIGSCSAGKALKKIKDQFRLQIAYHVSVYLCADNGGGPPAEIHSSYTKSLILGHHKVAGSHDPFFISERFVERLAQRNSYIFHRVVLVNVQIAFGLQLQIKSAVPRKKFKHVVKEANAGRYVITAFAFNGERKLDVCLCGRPMQPRLSHGAGCSSSLCVSAVSCASAGFFLLSSACFSPITTTSISFCFPMVMRTQPGTSGRSRRAIPHSRICLRMYSFSSPKFTRTKFPWLGHVLKPISSICFPNHSRVSFTCVTWSFTNCLSVTASRSTSSAHALTLNGPEIRRRTPMWWAG